MKIRTALQSDMECLLEIYNYEISNGIATLDLKEKTIEERYEWFFSHNTGNHPLIVAEQDGKAVGYASLSSYREKEAYKQTVELSVYIHPQYRRRGIAGSLINNLIEYAKANEAIHTIVSVITEGNEGSVKLHEQFGFQYCGIVREVGMKFGKQLNIITYQLMV